MGREPVGKSIDNRDTDTVETSRYLVGLLIEFSAGVQDREDDLEGTLAVLLHPVDRDAPAIILDHERAVPVDDNRDPAAVPGKGFIYRIIHDFVNEMVQAAGISAANIHRRPFADRGESFEDCDV